jgi:hypothetical protein
MICEYVPIDLLKYFMLNLVKELSSLIFYFLFRVFFGCLWVWTQGLTPGRQMLYHLSHYSSLFLWCVFFKIVSLTICSDWLQTVILLISDSWVVRIMSVSHQGFPLLPFQVFAPNRQLQELAPSLHDWNILFLRMFTSTCAVI